MSKELGETSVSVMSKPYAVFWISAVLAVPMWREFHEPDHPIWNASLAIFLVGIVAAAFFGLRYLERNRAEIGEARFTSAGHELDGS